jgi:hypothetical protein
MIARACGRTLETSARKGALRLDEMVTRPAVQNIIRSRNGSRLYDEA